MKHTETSTIYHILKLTRKLINISFLIIFIVLLLWGNYNPAAAFALIFYNALHWLLLSNQKNGNPSELNILKITFTVGVLLHLVLGYGFMYKLSIKINELKILPFILAAAIISFRYIGYFVLKIRLNKKSR